MFHSTNDFAPPSEWHRGPGFAKMRELGAQMGYGPRPPTPPPSPAVVSAARRQLASKAPRAPFKAKLLPTVLRLNPESLSVPFDLGPPVPQTQIRAQDFMSKTQFRKLRERAGLPLNADQHVCHIIAESNGGANHIDNYFVASSSLNQSLGNRNDSYLAEAVGLEQTQRAVAVSRSTGYTGPGADELISMAKAART